MSQEERVKQVVQELERQYKTENYGKLHRSLLERDIETDLYIGFGIEMHYPDAYDPQFILHVFDKDNLVVVDQRGSREDETFKKSVKTAESLGYKVKEFQELTEEEQEYYFM